MNSLLSKQDVKEIKQLFNTNLYSYADLVKLYDVDYRTINDILNKKLDTMRS